MAATETDQPTVRTAYLREGYRPEDAFLGVTLDPPPDEEVWFDVEANRWGNGTYYQQWLAVDLHTGAMWFGDTDFRKPPETLRGQLPGHLRRAVNDTTVPPNGVMVRSIPNVGYSRERGSEWKFLTEQELYELAVRVTPIVERLLATIHRVGARGELEWSALAETAWHDLENATEPKVEAGAATWPEPVLSEVPDFRREAAEFMAEHPELIPADLATASDAELDRIAAGERHGAHGPGVLGYLEAAGGQVYYPAHSDWHRHEIFGNRHALYAHRAKAAGHRTETQAAPWLDTEAGQRAFAAALKEYGSLADQSDARLAHLAQHLQDAAAVEDLALVGLAELLQHRRAAERRAVEDLLHREGSEAARLEGLLKEARGRRRISLMRVLAWSSDRTDRDLGAIASMSHTAVGDLRKAITGDDDTEQA